MQLCMCGHIYSGLLITHCRKVAEYGIHVKELKVEIYLTELYLCFENQEPITKVLSRSTTVGG